MTSPDPIARFSVSFARASSSESFDAARAAFATADAKGQPSVRFVLIKHWDARGFVVYTHLHSRKGRELAENAKASLAFHWSTTGEQVRVDGPVEPVSDSEADAYFASRPRGSQLGAWASEQSATLSSRAALEARLAEVTQRFADQPVPRPPLWSGFRVVPVRIEFWRDREDRLHDRELYTRAGQGWTTSLLSP